MRSSPVPSWIEWTVDGDRPAGGTVDDAIVAADVSLPSVV